MPNGRNGEAAKKRILEAQKVVVSAILNEWRKEWGMSYVLIVHNNGTGPAVFTRGRVCAAHWNEVHTAVGDAEHALETQKGDVRI